MRVLTDPAGLRAACDALRAAGSRVGFVPTMGALHSGHMSLLGAVRARGAERVVLSVFVNPLQFGVGEDLAKYPRPREQDLALCAEHAVDLVYAPEPAAMYSTQFQTHVEVAQLTRPFEGELRPEHFRGVTTVVTKLLNAVGPCIAAFGRKDYQQWRVVDRMVRDLDIPADVIGCPIVRDPDGLALSSRNRYLSPAERQRATAIYAGLSAADAAFRAGERDPSRLVHLARARVEASFDAVDYVRLADAETLVPCESVPLTRGPVLLIAARLGATRLIDNAVLGEDSPVASAPA
jgi:pantoate--beta-alanine ligase